MNKGTKLLTIDELLELHRRNTTEKAHKIFCEDFYQTQEDLKEVCSYMSDAMFQGKADSEQEKLIIKRYNKLCVHHSNLMKTLERLSWRK